MGVSFLTYEELLKEADSMGLIVKEKPLHGTDGRILNKRIAIRKDIPTQKEKSCVLAEEIGHHATSYGNILNQNETPNRKQELQARLYGYNLKIGLSGIVKAHQAGCRNIYEMAEYLEVTEEYLKEALECYRRKYGMCATLDNYIIYFEPRLGIMKIQG